MTFGDRLRASWKLVQLVIVTVAYCVATNLRALLISPAHRPRFRAERQRFGCSMLCRIIGIRVTINRLPTDGAGMIVSNHFGILDPLVLASRLPVAFVAKSEIERWPFVGWVTRTMGVIFVHRDRAHRTSDFVEQVRQRIDDGVQVLVFPEGTTSHNMEVRRFKTGAFAAIAGRDTDVTPAHLSVVTVDSRPLDDHGRERVVWADSPRSFMEQFFLLLSMREATFHIVVGEPVSAATRNRKRLAEELQDLVTRLADDTTEARQ
jgi:lyso-ornithine lipid O-acyltransferase